MTQWIMMSELILKIKLEDNGLTRVYHIEEGQVIALCNMCFRSVPICVESLRKIYFSLWVMVKKFESQWPRKIPDMECRCWCQLFIQRFMWVDQVNLKKPKQNIKNTVDGSINVSIYGNILPIYPNILFFFF